MSISTWHNIMTGLHAAVYDSYAAKSNRQRAKHEVVDVMADVDVFCQRKQIVHDWSGFYFDGTVYTDAEEEEMIRKQFNIPK